MKVLFLGTGAAEGLPALFCNCKVCEGARERGGPNLRTRCSILIDGTVKIDLPPDTLAHVHAYPQMRLWELRHLLFTHSHDDHFAVRELQYLSPNFAPERRDPLCVHATAELIEKMHGEMRHFFEKAPLRFCPIKPCAPFAVDALTVTPIVAHHKQDEVCLNFVLHHREENRRVLYACDTGWYDAPTWSSLAAMRLDTVIVECGKGASDNPYNGHLNIGEASEMRREMIRLSVIEEGTPFYLTHIAHTGGLLHEEMSAVVEPLGMRVAFDGLEIAI